MTSRDIHPHGYEPALRHFAPPETFGVPARLPPSVRTGFGGAVHYPYRLLGRGAVTMCGRTVLVATVDGEPVTCRSCLKRVDPAPTYA